MLLQTRVPLSIVKRQLVLLLSPKLRLWSYYHLPPLEVRDNRLQGVTLTPLTINRPDTARTELTY